MGLFDHFPYTNFHELNLTWALEQLRKLESELENFVNLNTIKYANPIQWNITTQYEANTIVVDPNTGTAYISVQPVPAGVALANTDYWNVVFTLDLTTANKNITLRDDGSNVLSTFSSVIGDWLIWNGILYKVIQNINTNEAYVIGSNISRYTIELFIKDYISNITNAITALSNSINTTIGDLNNLTTSDKTSIVNAINEVVSNLNNLSNNIGDLNSLTTSDKSSLVSAINEVVTALSILTGNFNNIKYYVTPEEYGAVGDGVTDDTDAFRQAFLTNLPVICMPNKEYIVGEIDLSSLERLKLLDGNLSIIRGMTLHINCVAGSQTPIEPFAWRSYIRNVHFIANDNEDCIHIGGGLKIENCICDNYDTFCRFTDNYIDDVIFIQIGFRNYNRGDRDAFRVHHLGLGDLFQIKGVHCTGNTAYMAKHTFGFSFATGRADNCINTGFSFTSASDFTIANSFYGIGYTAEFKVSNPARSLITVDSCVFAGVRYIFDGCNYKNCWFKETAVSGGIASKGLSIDKFKTLENCNISVGNTANTLSTQNIIHSKYDDSNFNYSISSAHGIVSVGLSVLDSDNQVEGVPQTGTYEYHVVPSMFPDALVRYNSNILSGYQTVSANAGQSITMVYNDDFKKAYKHVYRVNPDSSIDYAVVPPTDPTLTGVQAGCLIDNGTLCGFKWNSISALPTLAASSVSMKNGIVSATDPNLPSGSLYLDVDATVKQV